MFRYLAFSWNDASPAQVAVARRLEEALQVQGWGSVLNAYGFRVYMTGHVRGVNDAYPLPGGQGVVLGRLFRRSASRPILADEITLTEREAQQITHSDGRALIEQFWGRYVAFLPSWTGEPRVLRDPTGTLPCFRIETEGVSVATSRLEDLFALLPLPMPTVDWDAVAAHMVLGVVSGRETLLSGVTQVLAGELAPLATTGGAPKQLWSAVDQARQPTSASPAEAARLLSETVTACVQNWASCHSSIVLRLSGGVDSSILLSALASDPAIHSRLTCLNYYLSDTDTDERPYARLAAQLHAATLVERPLDQTFRLDSVLDVTRTATPANYLGLMGTNRVDGEVAKSVDAGAVFNGAGGDQLFFEVRCTWPAADYLKLRGIDRGYLPAVLDAAHLGHVSFWQALRSSITDQRFRGDPIHGAGRYLTLMHTDAQHNALRAAHRFVHPGWLAAEDLPIGKFNQLSMVICPFEYYNHYRNAATHERVQPLMSQPLLELCLALPTFVLTQGGRGRGLARSAFADSIPAEIAGRRSKGGMERYIAAVLRDNLPFARELLLDGMLVKHGLLDRQRTEATLAGRPAAKTGYLTEIHACIATEAWLRRTTARSDPITA